ncbi:hypothetical protein K0U07_03105 [bacterium]|nr:hypothetical protein [bacterium]
MADSSKITVDNLPIDYSIQFEENKSNQDDGHFDDASRVRDSVSMDTLDTSIDSATDSVVSPGRTARSPWGAAEKPDTKGYNTKRAFLSNQLTEKFGPQDKLDAMGVRIEGIKEERSMPPSSAAPSAAPAAEKSSVENEANTLLSLVSTIGEINRIKEHIDGEMKRIQKG